MLEIPDRIRSSRPRRLARLIAITSGSAFVLSLMVMLRWIFRLRETQETADASLPTPFDAIMPLIAATVATLAFPIAMLSIVALVRLPESRENDHPPDG